jgi:serine protease Do
VTALGACSSAPPPATPAPPPPATAAAPKAAPAHLSPAEIAARGMPAICTVRTERGLGTGFVVDPAGIIVTNLHVVAGATRILVTFADERAFPVVEIAGYSEHHDLAALRVDASALPVLSIGDSDALRPGDPIVAIGDPLGLEHTVSSGLVSAIRAVDESTTVLQISAPISPGSSGGPIFDEHGNVVGVATAILRGGENIAFGMPSRYVKDLLASPAPVSVAALAELLERRHPRSPSPPPPKRDVPHHPLALLSGCSPPALKQIIGTIGSTIEVGAPLYNGGNFAACYHVYEGAAQDLERKLPPACKGPAKALAAGRTKAATLTDPSDQAWAMRDAFDGVLEVIARKTRGGGD